MIQIKFDLGAEVFYFNDAEQRVESDSVAAVHVIPTSVIKDESGKDIVERSKVFYQLSDGTHVSEGGVFSSKDECISYYAALFGSM